MAELFAADGGENGGVCHGAKVGVLGDAELRKACRQADLLYEACKSLDAGKSGLLIAAFGLNAPHVLRKTCKARRAGFAYVAIQYRMDHCKRRAVVAVGVSAELMLKHMAWKSVTLSIFKTPFSAIADAHASSLRAS